MSCRENHAPAGGRGVVFVGGPNSAAYRQGGGAGRGARGGTRPEAPGGSAYSTLPQGTVAAGYGEKAVEGPPQVSDLTVFPLHWAIML